MTDDDLKRAYQARHAEPGCPDKSVLVNAAAGELNVLARRNFADHLGRCARCAAEYRELRAVHAWAQDAVPSTGTRAWPVYVGAVAAVLIAAVWMGSRTPSPSTPPNLRAPVNTEGLSGIEPSGDVNQAVITFRWRATANATAYRIVVFTPNGSEVWRSADVAASEVTLPGKQIGDGSYYWQVIALRGGDVVRESNLTAFRISPR